MISAIIEHLGWLYDEHLSNGLIDMAVVHMNWICGEHLGWLCGEHLGNGLITWPFT